MPDTADAPYLVPTHLREGQSIGPIPVRVFFVDVWVFDPVYRIVSFIVLGLVLLVVGYCYNRLEEKLRRWL